MSFSLQKTPPVFVYRVSVCLCVYLLSSDARLIAPDFQNHALLCSLQWY